MLSLIVGTLNEFLVITGEYMNQKTASAPAAENKMGTMPIGRLLFLSLIHIFPPEDAPDRSEYILDLFVFALSQS